MMKKDLNYYLTLPYKTEIVPIPAEKGGGFLARLPQFGTLGIVGDGETPEEALSDLAESQKERFQQYLDEGLVIPEPEPESEEYSGRFVLRLPRFLHRELAQFAKKNGVSLNQYVCTLLAVNFQSDKLTATLTGMEEEIQALNQCIGALKYHIKRMQQPSGYQIDSKYADEYPAAA